MFLPSILVSAGYQPTAWVIPTLAFLKKKNKKHKETKKKINKTNFTKIDKDRKVNI